MSTHEEILQEEIDVLEAIYADDFEKVSDDTLRIHVSPEDQATGEEVRLLLEVTFPPEYPDVIPRLTVTTEEGEMSEDEEAIIVECLENTAKDSLGMAQTFNVVTALVEAIGAMIENRNKKAQQAEEDKYRREEEAEVARTRGTPVTQESFNKWRTAFNAKQAALKARQEEEKLKAFSPKEREEIKKIAYRPTGKQLFEKNKDLATSDANLLEEGTVSVDISKYDRTAVQEEEDLKEDRVHFSDSD